MEKLAKMRLFSLLTESSQVTNDEMQSAYESFMTNVLTANQPEMDCETAFRLLSMTLRTQVLYEQGGKMRLKIYIVRKQSYLLNLK